VENTRYAVNDRGTVGINRVRNVGKLLFAGEMRFGEVVGKVNLFFRQHMHGKPVHPLKDAMRLRGSRDVKRDERRVQGHARKRTDGDPTNIRTVGHRDDYDGGRHAAHRHPKCRRVDRIGHRNCKGS